MTLAKMEKAVADFKSKLLSIYKVHLNAITSLPDMEEEYEEFYNSRTGIAPKEASAPAAEPEEAAAQPKKRQKRHRKRQKSRKKRKRKRRKPPSG